MNSIPSLFSGESIFYYKKEDSTPLLEEGSHDTENYGITPNTMTPFRGFHKCANESGATCLRRYVVQEWSKPNARVNLTLENVQTLARVQLDRMEPDYIDSWSTITYEQCTHYRLITIEEATPEEFGRQEEISEQGERGRRLYSQTGDLSRRPLPRSGSFLINLAKAKPTDSPPIGMSNFQTRKKSNDE